ncbi:hypothetical protein [Oleidesulfovibrio sp.]|uniref:hypothetical protein n=1 Tax=Oleidesulfovibrio sp. TaxID=2909707 RepID=UPI003A875D45
MKKASFIQYGTAVSLLAVLLLSGCSTPADAPPPPPPPAQVVVDYDAQALTSYQQARQFVAQGRFELAREQYLIALAIARNDYMRERLMHELQATELMLRSSR